MPLRLCPCPPLAPLPPPARPLTRAARRYTDMCTKMHTPACGSVVADGGTILSKGSNATLLTLTEAADGEFSMVFSMTHAIADGRT